MNKTQAERILELLRLVPDLDDDEISACTGILPRQAVNQVCRRLETNGLLIRLQGPRGKIVNRLVVTSSRQKIPPSCVTSGSTPQPSPPSIQPKTGDRVLSTTAIPTNKTPEKQGIVTQQAAQTLFILPCSGRKHIYPGRTEGGPAITDYLPSEVADALRSARAANMSRARVDESSRVPAWERYGGTLYQEASCALKSAVAAGRHVLILSGGYGVVLATEPIGNYEAVFKPSWWPRGLLEHILEAYTARHHLQAVRALVSGTTSYRKVVEKVNWRRAGVSDAVLLVPAEVGPGAMVKAPRAQGQAFATLLDGSISTDWTSSDGVFLQVEDCLRTLGST